MIEVIGADEVAEDKPSGLKNIIVVQDREMARAKLTEEERKQRIQAKNQRYYNAHKDKWNAYNGSDENVSVVYAITGIPNDMVYVGVTKTLKQREAQHKAHYGDWIKFEPIITFRNPAIPLRTLKYFENLMITGHYGSDKCINVHNNRLQSEKIEQREGIMSEYLGYVNDEERTLIQNAIGQVKKLSEQKIEE